MNMDRLPPEVRALLEGQRGKGFDAEIQTRVEEREREQVVEAILTGRKVSYETSDTVGAGTEWRGLERLRSAGEIPDQYQNQNQIRVMEPPFSPLTTDHNQGYGVGPSLRSVPTRGALPSPSWEREIDVSSLEPSAPSSSSLPMGVERCFEQDAERTTPVPHESERIDSWRGLNRYSTEMPFTAEQVCVQVFCTPGEKLKWSVKVEVNWESPTVRNKWQHVFGSSLVPRKEMEQNRWPALQQWFLKSPDQAVKSYMLHCQREYEAVWESEALQAVACLFPHHSSGGKPPNDRPLHLWAAVSLDGRPNFGNQSEICGVRSGTAHIVLGDIGLLSAPLKLKATKRKGWCWQGFWWANQTDGVPDSGDDEGIGDDDWV